jgi:hypothetical protein
MGEKTGSEETLAKYKKLMRAMANRAEGQTIDAIVKDIYGLPLSGKNGETDSLEWRFLDWLAKGK